jgi:aldehyde:ferredoxin oxidoreductase
MLNNYYSILGWDIKTGRPLQETLKALGIEHVIKDIW